MYILCNRRNETLYTGVTSDLIKRVYEHKNGLVDGFTKTYGVHTLVWYEQHQTAEAAFIREKQIKKWNRSWKMDLIEKSNPEWLDLYCDLVHEPGFPLPDYHLRGQVSRE
ncbi:MAG: GIY-YIG nuclease family protein [Nitrospirota bacterium]